MAKSRPPNLSPLDLFCPPLTLMPTPHADSAPGRGCQSRKENVATHSLGPPETWRAGCKKWGVGPTKHLFASSSSTHTHPYSPNRLGDHPAERKSKAQDSVPISPAKQQRWKQASLWLQGQTCQLSVWFLSDFNVCF